MNSKRKILLVGWDAADWQIMNPMIAAGKMPTLASLIANGVSANLSTIKPMLSPMLWNSIATGKRADKHGITGFIEPKADGTGVQPTSSTSRKCKAIWNILTQRGLKSNVVSWYASHPAEPIDGAIVSEHFPRVDGDSLPPVSPQAIHPPRLIEAMSELRVLPSEMTGWHLAPFVPTLGEIPLEETPPVTGLRRFLARAASTHAAATYLLEHEPADFTAVYYEAIDHTSHGFMHYHPPRMPHVDPKLFERYKGVIEGIYRFHDMMLERLIQLAGDDTTVVVCSDHGFVNDHLRPIESPESDLSPEAWHRHHGMLVMSGPGIKQNEKIYGATILDLTPTLLTLFGLPIGDDMDGRVLTSAFTIPPTTTHTPSWELEAGEAGMHPPDLRVDPFEEQATLAQLVELGYIDPPSGDATKSIGIAVTESTFNLAIAELDAEHDDQAFELLRGLLAKSPGNSRFASPLAGGLVTKKRFAETLDVLRTIPEIAALLAFEATGNFQEPWPAFTPELGVILSVVDLGQGRAEIAFRRLVHIASLDVPLPHVQIQIGTIYLRERKWHLAKQCFINAIALDDTSPVAHFGKGMAHMHLDELVEACESLMKSTSLMNFYPRAHFSLGVVLARMELYERAVQSFEILLKMRPGTATAHRYLAALQMRLGNPDRALYHRTYHRRLFQMAQERFRSQADGQKSDAKSTS